MGGRDLVVLGTASQVPTRTRNHNGYLLRWDTEQILFDPGEGTQRQFTFSGVSPAKVSRICLTHLHGDHCLGVPGMLQRLALDQVHREIPISFPATGRHYVEHLCDASIGRRQPVRLVPVGPDGGVVDEGPPVRITARPLAHRVDAVGYRVEEGPRVHLLRDRLEAAGILGPDRARLLADGEVTVSGRTFPLAAMSEARPGHAFAIVMDTAVCDNAIELAAGVDVLLCEATFLESESFLARDYGHLTAREAATIAREAGVGHLVLTHFSARYPSPEAHLAEAAAVFPAVTGAEDLAVIPFPTRGADADTADEGADADTADEGADADTADEGAGRAG